MIKWKARKLQLKTHNFITTAILVDNNRSGICYKGGTIWKDDENWNESFQADWQQIWAEGEKCEYWDLPLNMLPDCPGCGKEKKPHETECSRCGIYFEKTLAAMAEAANEERAAVLETIAETAPAKTALKIFYVVFAIFIITLMGYNLVNRPAGEKALPQPVETVKEIETGPAAIPKKIVGQIPDTEEEFIEIGEPEKTKEGEVNKKSKKQYQETVHRNLVKEEETLRKKNDSVNARSSILMEEYETLTKEKEAIKTKEDREAYNHRLEAYEKNNEDVQKKRKDLDTEIEAHNERVIEDLKEKLNELENMN